MPKTNENLKNRKFGRLTVLKYFGKGRNGLTMWECGCTCKRKVIVSTSSLKSGNTKSCGCLSKESTIKSNKERRVYRENSNKRILSIWKHLFKRCENEKTEGYSLYGGRGIKICDEWRDFDNFESWAIENGYEENLSIDRIDNNGNYEPSNCRWATNKEQGNNRRTNRNITINGVTKNITQWAEEVGIDRKTIEYRIKVGKSNDEILFKGNLKWLK